MKKKISFALMCVLLFMALIINIFAAILFPRPFNIVSFASAFIVFLILLLILPRILNISFTIFSNEKDDLKIEKIVNEYKSAFREIEEKNSYLLERYNILDEIRKEYKRNMVNVSKMQASLLPEKIFEHKNVDHCVLYTPSDVIGGDFYDCVKLDNHKSVFIISDISGHGINAAIISSMLKVVFQIYAKSTHSPRELLVKINTELIKCMPDNYCLSAIVMVLDSKTRSITYSNASHPPFLILHKDKDKDEIEEITLSDTIIGFFPNADYHEQTISLKKNDALFFYTDGITEASRSKQKKDLYGTERLKSAILKCKNMKLHEMINFIKHDFFRYLSFRSPDDDITLIALKIR